MDCMLKVATVDENFQEYKNLQDNYARLNGFMNVFFDSLTIKLINITDSEVDEDEKNLTYWSESFLAGSVYRKIQK